MSGLLEGQGPGARARYALGPRVASPEAVEIYFGERDLPPAPPSRVAVKHVRRDLASFAPLRERLIAQALESASAANPNLTAVIELIENAAGVYLVLEQPTGTSVAAVSRLVRARGEQLSVELAAFIALELARGIHAIHTAHTPSGQRLGALVRELTPAHVLLTSAGEVKIANRALASVLAEVAPLSPTEQFGYYAPERIAGEPVNPRVDIYAAGVALADLLLGRPYFEGATADEVLGAVVAKGGISAPLLVAAGAPSDLAAIAAKAASFLPERRHAAAGELADELARWVARHAPPAMPRVLMRFLTLHGLLGPISEDPSTAEQVRAALAARPDVRALFGDRAPTPEECAFVMSVLRDGITEAEAHALRCRTERDRRPPTAATPRTSVPPGPVGGNDSPRSAALRETSGPAVAPASVPPRAPTASAAAAPAEVAEDEEDRPMTPAEKRRARRRWWRETLVLIAIGTALLFATAIGSLLESMLSMDREEAEILYLERGE